MVLKYLSRWSEIDGTSDARLHVLHFLAHFWIPTSRVWSVGDKVSRIDNDISNSWVSFCLPNATAPLVTIIHSRPSRWHSATYARRENIQQTRVRKNEQTISFILYLKISIHALNLLKASLRFRWINTK